VDLLARLQAALVAHYRIERELGRGGMATVYLAEDLKHRRRVALKVLRPEIGAALGMDRFLREITTCAALQHPHILGLIDSGEIPPTHDGGPALLYYAMPYIEGESLRGRLDRERQLPLHEAITIAREVADALGYAHAHDVVHRDIKPENIMLSGGHAMVADFGIAKALTTAGGEKLTETGLALGTPCYMSPEQATGDTLDGRADEYALGCVVYEMLAGAPPFHGSSGQSIMARHAVDPVPSLRTVREMIPAGVERAITRALAKSPADRFATTAEFALALTQGATGPVTVVTQAAAAASGERRRRGWGRVGWVLAAGLVAIGLMTGVRAFTRNRGGMASPAGRSIRFLAVTPLENLTGDPAQTYLAQGVTDQLIANLAQIASLTVIKLPPRRGDRAPADIARERGVDIDAVLAGSFQRSAGEVRITAQITLPTTERAIWARSYTGQLRNILDLQDSVVRAVADTIRASLTPHDSTRLNAAKKPIDPAAYEAYLRGASSYGRNTGADFRKAIGFFREAIRLEPTYALAYTGLASCYIDLGYFALESPEETFPKARSAAEKALELDPALGQAYANIGRIDHLYAWDFAAADRNFRRAVELTPQTAVVHLNYLGYLAPMKRSEEAIAEGKRSIELDPLFTLYRAAAARPYYNARRYPEAIAQAKQALADDSTFSRAHFWLGLAYEQISRLPDAIRELEATVKYAGTDSVPVYLAALGHAYAIAGKPDKARRLLAALEARPYISPVDVATIHVGLGERDQAFEWLERALKERAYGLVFLPTDPRFDPVRGDPRFAAVMRRVGLPK
jgi:serine/threonine-protein kinase